MSEALLHRIALSMAKGVHGSTLEGILDRAGDPSAFFSLSRPELTRLFGMAHEMFSDSYRQALLQQAAKELEFIKRNGINALFMGEPGYPARLSDVEDAPVILYSLGPADLDSAHMVAIVGTRHATPYGVDFTTRLVQDLSRSIDNLVIVSGLAYGIDIAAHKAALAAGVPTVAVVAHGLNTLYPADHRDAAARIVRDGGAIVTEYRSDSIVHRGNFLARNRIVAGLSDCVVVVESDYRGGAMATARIGLQYGREVMAVPGRINDTYSRGTNRLIANNTASLITGAEDLTRVMEWAAASKARTAAADSAPTLFHDLRPELQEILDFIRANPEATVNDMCVRLDKPYNVISNHLMEMDMDGVIRSLPGGRYEEV